MAGEYDAAIAAGAQVASTAMNTASAAKANKKERAWMSEQSQINWDRQQQMWNQTNEFNLKVSDPAFQMERLRQAGLNPWLAQGKPEIIEAKMGNAPAPQSHEWKRPNIDLGQASMAYLQTKMMQKQMQVADADIQTKIAQSQKTDAETNAIQTLLPGQSEGLSLDNINKSLQSDQLKTATSKIQSEIVNLQKSGTLTDAQTQNVKTMTAKGLKEIDNLISQGQLIHAQTREKQIANQIISATAPGKIEAENARNKLTTETGGMSDKPTTYIPGMIIGKTLRDGRGFIIPKKGQKNMLNFSPNEVPKNLPNSKQ